MINIEISQENSQEIKDTYCIIERLVEEKKFALKFDEPFKAVSRLLFQVIPIKKDRFVQYVREDKAYVLGNYQKTFAIIDEFNSAESSEDLYCKLGNCEDDILLTFFEFFSAYLRSNRNLSTHTDLEKNYWEGLHFVFSRLAILMHGTMLIRNCLWGGRSAGKCRVGCDQCVNHY